MAAALLASPSAPWEAQRRDVESAGLTHASSRTLPSPPLLFASLFVDNASTGERSWDRCVFQSIADDPIDQVLFGMMGGRMADWQADFSSVHCDAWYKPNKRSNCPCTAPHSLIGNHTFVEIGANDGLHMSNSWFFESFLGWRGMCIEPNPRVFTLLRANRPRCLNVNAFVSMTSNGSTTLPFISFYRKRPKHDPTREWETGMSGVEGSNPPNSVLATFERAQKFANQTRGLFVERSMLPVHPFSKLFELHSYTSIDLLSIDVEGHEYEVLSSIDFKKVYIRIIVTETSTEKVRRLLQRQGFRDLHMTFRLGDKIFVNREPRP
ncbi:MAG: hypothetical protein SGPRY_013564 [Prymnesium sp.]